MARIRAIKPEFWSILDDLSVTWELVYDQPFPTGPRPYKNLPGMRDNTEYVYVLSDAKEDAVYVGRSFRPADRFTQHRKRPWWRVVTYLTIYRITGTCRIDAEKKVARAENAFINELAPYGNIARGQLRREWHGKD